MNIIDWFNRTIFKKKKERHFYLEKDSFINGVFFSFSTLSSNNDDKSPTLTKQDKKNPANPQEATYTDILSAKRQFISSFLNQCYSGNLESPKTGKTLIVTANGSLYERIDYSDFHEDSDNQEHKTVSYFNAQSLISKSTDQIHSDINNNHVIIFDIEGMDLFQSLHFINVFHNIIASELMMSCFNGDIIDNISYDGVLQYLIDQRATHISKFNLVAMSNIDSPMNTAMMTGIIRMRGVYRFFIEEKTIDELIESSADNKDILSDELLYIKSNNRFSLTSYADETTCFTIVDGKLCLKSNHPADVIMFSSADNDKIAEISG